MLMLLVIVLLTRSDSRAQRIVGRHRAAMCRQCQRTSAAIVGFGQRQRRKQHAIIGQLASSFVVLLLLAMLSLLLAAIVRRCGRRAMRDTGGSAMTSMMPPSFAIAVLLLMMTVRASAVRRIAIKHMTTVACRHRRIGQRRRKRYAERRFHIAFLQRCRQVTQAGHMSGDMLWFVCVWSMSKSTSSMYTIAIYW